MEFVPEWLQSLTYTMQQRADAKYQDELATYKAAAQEWITANKVNRQMGLPVTEFTRAVPTRLVFGVESGVLTQSVVTDSNIQRPTLPDAEGKGDEISAVLKVITEIQARVQAIATKVGL